MHAQALVTTEHASRYLQQLCKHFGHKVEATFTPEVGRIAFPFGICTLAAEGDQLTLGVDAETGEELERLKDVIASHLLRFAFREELAVVWS